MWPCIPVAWALKIGFVGLVDTEPVSLPVKGNMRFPRTGNDLSPSTVLPNYHSVQLAVCGARQERIICLCTLIWTLPVIHLAPNQISKLYSKDPCQGSWRTVLLLYPVPCLTGL